MNLVYAASAYPFGRLSDRVAHEALLVAGLLALTAAELLLDYCALWPCCVCLCGQTTLSRGKQREAGLTIAICGFFAGITGVPALLPPKYTKTTAISLITIALFVLALAMGATILVLTMRLRSARASAIALQRTLEEMQADAIALKERAYYDHLTGLANRSLLIDRFHLAIERSKRSRVPFAAVMIDLNNFKYINDTHGHAAGDQVLVTIGKRLMETVRASDTVSRLGGDEFVLIIESIEDRRELAQIGQKLIDMLAEKVVLDSGKEVSIGGSLGFALYPGDGASMETMLHVADQAMYDCKTSGMMPLF